MEALALGLVPWLVGFSLVCFVLSRIVRRQRRPRPTRPEVPADTPVPEQSPGQAAPTPLPAPRSELPYARQRALLTDAERDCFAALCAAAPAGWHVFPQVRLAPRAGAAGHAQLAAALQPHRREVRQLRALRARRAHPRLVVELDDASHSRPDRQRRDAFVDAALAAAGLPILHVRWQRRYEVARLAADIQAAAGLAPAPILGGFALPLQNHN